MSRHPDPQQAAILANLLALEGLVYRLSEQVVCARLAITDEANLNLAYGHLIELVHLLPGIDALHRVIQVLRPFADEEAT